jgi:hypothetical protein
MGRSSLTTSSTFGGSTIGSMCPSSFSDCCTSTAGGVVIPTLSSVSILALAPRACRLKGYAMPPAVGRVLEPSVAGISVAGASGWAETTRPGGVKTALVGLLISLVGDGRGEALRSGAICVASARGMGGATLERFSDDVSAWPLSVTAECRECERVRVGGGAVRVVPRLRLGSVAGLLSVAPSTAG